MRHLRDRQGEPLPAPRWGQESLKGRSWVKRESKDERVKKRRAKSQEEMEM